MSKQKPELKHFGLDFFRPIMKELLNTDYLHYGYWEPGTEIRFSNVRKVQERFVEILVEHIPQGTETILDVGCGTGEIARYLIGKGFRVDAVSPSEDLNRVAREKIGGNGTVTTAFFQEFHTDKKYDLVMFSESFQYVPFREALQKAAGVLNENGHVLLCDFFRRDVEGKSPIGGGHSIGKFLEYLPDSGFEKIEDEDITDFTAPTIDLRDRFFKKLIVPVGEASSSYLAIRYPKVLKIILWAFRKKLEKFQNKYIRQIVNAEVFKKFKTYRLMLLKKL